jgi:hypothetical protein
MQTPARRDGTLFRTAPALGRWFSRPDEALLLKCCDTPTDGRARFMPHTSFTDPTTPLDAPPR